MKSNPTMVEDRRKFALTESIAEAERLFIEDFDTWDMTGYYPYSKYCSRCLRSHWHLGKLEAEKAELSEKIAHYERPARGFDENLEPRSSFSQTLINSGFLRA